MQWLRELTGLPDDSPATVRAGVDVQGEWLTLRASGLRLRAVG